MNSESQKKTLIMERKAIDAMHKIRHKNKKWKDGLSETLDLLSSDSHDYRLNRHKIRSTGVEAISILGTRNNLRIIIRKEDPDSITIENMGNHNIYKKQ